ncbi:hypothetical protein [Dysgonomonas sp. 511]|uniref:hypothetical protein n=1 Tax=Dysgonomonas sp. 511 TaxID=2302930 RepID=UPI0013CFE823|nr:hypothetical protein [Dysgonomonas sp. 511]
MNDLRFCVFIDLLGFKNKIEEDFTQATHFYQRCMKICRGVDNSLVEIIAVPLKSQKAL